MSRGARKVKYTSEAGLDEINAGNGSTVTKRRVDVSPKVGDDIRVSVLAVKDPPSLVLLFFRRR